MADEGRSAADSGHETEEKDVLSELKNVQPKAPKVSEEFAMPQRNWKQTLALAFYTNAPILALVATIVCTLMFPYLMLLYFLVIYMEKSQYQGGRMSVWARRLPIWEWFRDYFPITLVKSVDLDPTKNYIFGYHPHGFIGHGAFLNFATEATGFSKKFPGIVPHLMTLPVWFNLPFFREMIYSLGLVDAGKESFNFVLNSGPGQSAAIILGGAAESLDAHPGTFDLTLADRKGFARIALKNGAALVPVFAFGETDLYTQLDNPRGSWIRKIQNKIQSLIGLATPLLIGHIGFMPHRRLVTVVVGSPLQCPKIKDPTPEDVDTYHKMYCEALTKLYDSYKETFARERRKSLAILPKAR